MGSAVTTSSSQPADRQQQAGLMGPGREADEGEDEEASMASSSIGRSASEQDEAGGATGKEEEEVAPPPPVTADPGEIDLDDDM